MNDYRDDAGDAHDGCYHDSAVAAAVSAAAAAAAHNDNDNDGEGRTVSYDLSKSCYHSWTSSPRYTCHPSFHVFASHAYSL